VSSFIDDFIKHDREYVDLVPDNVRAAVTTMASAR
jgi:hypothetical protein